MYSTWNEFIILIFISQIDISNIFTTADGYIQAKWNIFFHIEEPQVLAYSMEHVMELQDQRAVSIVYHCFAIVVPFETSIVFNRYIGSRYNR